MHISRPFHLVDLISSFFVSASSQIKSNVQFLQQTCTQQVHLQSSRAGKERDETVTGEWTPLQRQFYWLGVCLLA